MKGQQALFVLQDKVIGVVRDRIKIARHGGEKRPFRVQMPVLGAGEFDEFERGVKQAQLLKTSEPVRHTGGYWGDPENDVTGSVPYRKAPNSYLLAKKK